MQRLKWLLAFLLLLTPVGVEATTLTDAPEFTANEIYELQATDPVEGAAIGAAFGGIGYSNEQAQQLANRTSLLNNHRVTDEANIAAIQAFDALFVGAMGQNGYLKLPVADTAKGQIQYIIQWGLVNYGSPQSEGLEGPYSFPVTFPNACEVFIPVTLTNEGPGAANAGDNVAMVSVGQPPSASQFWVWNNQIAGTNKSQGFIWLAIGY